MSRFNPLSKAVDCLDPANLDKFFSREQERNYVSILMERGGLTRRRAEYFVRLWAYLFLKQQTEQTGQAPPPLTQLSLPQGSVACTHREAAELFYGHKDRGSDRAAGMMIDRLVSLGLLEKRFDGQTLCLQVHPLPELLVSPTARSEEPIALEADAFNPRTDAIPTANLIARSYAELIQSNRSLKDPMAASHKIVRVLRSWAQQYGAGMRVLRRQDNRNPVAIAVLYPVANESEAMFFQPFSKGVYLTADTEADPFQPAPPGDPACTAVYIRAWTIDLSYLRRDTLILLLQDTQQTLRQMRQDYPNLCDVYSAFIHPAYEELKLALGFQEVSHDKQRSYAWIYLALDHFLELNVQQVLANLKFGQPSGVD
jgi:hypothetical protein